MANPAVSTEQFDLVYDVLSFSLATMMATTIFIWLRLVRYIHPFYGPFALITFYLIITLINLCKIESARNSNYYNLVNTITREKLRKVIRVRLSSRGLSPLLPPTITFASLTLGLRHTLTI